MDHVEGRSVGRPVSLETLAAWRYGGGSIIGNEPMLYSLTGRTGSDGGYSEIGAGKTCIKDSVYPATQTPTGQKLICEITQPTDARDNARGVDLDSVSEGIITNFHGVA